jgi:FdhD protein
LPGTARGSTHGTLRLVIPPAATFRRTAVRGHSASDGFRTVPEETPIALTYNRTTHAVMLATPANLEDFAIGFSLSEGIITEPAQVQELEVVSVPEGVEARMSLDPDRLDRLSRRHRRLAGPSGCGLCGLDSLKDAIRPVPVVGGRTRIAGHTLIAAMASLQSAQSLNQLTHGVHAAAFWTPGRGLGSVREDVGRHNALDKLVGALARNAIPAHEGVLLLTSRVSVEMVQKAAVMGVAIVAAVSVPTALAIRTAEQAGITLVAIARQDGFEVFTHPGRITLDPMQHVA